MFLVSGSTYRTLEKGGSNYSMNKIGVVSVVVSSTARDICTCVYIAGTVRRTERRFHPIATYDTSAWYSILPTNARMKQTWGGLKTKTLATWNCPWVFYAYKTLSNWMRFSNGSI